MALEENQVTLLVVIGGAEKVVEADVKKGGAGGETGDVAAEFRGETIRVHHHRHRIPADD